ncbi:MAG: permease [Deltaproteobacteria bacterium]|nr:permease [Deltaproteobacteria bacterium]
MSAECCHTHTKRRFDYLLWGSLIVIAPAYFAALFGLLKFPYVAVFTVSVFELLNRMWWGLALGIVFVGILDRVPREFVIAALGRRGGLPGILRATLAGLALDLCSHGILLVGMKLYERGASLGQTMAFLIASPWNSFSLTLILWALIGLKWTLAFVVLSLLVAVVSGLIFERLTAAKVLPANPNVTSLPDGFFFWPELKKQWRQTRFHSGWITDILRHGLKESRMVLRWVFFGAILASLVRTFLPLEHFQAYFGPTLLGLGLTTAAATVIEVCSEGSTPIAADILTRALAPGNAFAFLMAGVATDYTEIMVLKETTRSWKIALFLPLVTLPQVVVLGWLLNA